MHSEYFKDQFKEAKKHLKNILSKCTDEQVELFNRMYVSIEDIPDDKIDWAISQVERTLNK